MQKNNQTSKHLGNARCNSELSLIGGRMSEQAPSSPEQEH